jgi:hypothetical protein
MSRGRDSVAEGREVRFTLLFRGPDPVLAGNGDLLAGAGCADAVFGRRDDLFYAEFRRHSTSLPLALRAAIEAMEGAIPGLTVIRIEPDDVVGAAEIARRVNRSQESIRLLFEGERGPGGFPTPIAWVGQKRKVWAWSDVAEWWQRYNGGFADADAMDALWIASTNAALQLRRHSSRLRESAEGRTPHDWLLNLPRSAPYLQATIPALLVHLPSWAEEEQDLSRIWIDVAPAQANRTRFVVAVHDGLTRGVWEVKRWQWRSESPTARFEGIRRSHGEVYEAFVGEFGKRLSIPKDPTSPVWVQLWSGPAPRGVAGHD